jgi:hypothetical protein
MSMKKFIMLHLFLDWGRQITIVGDFQSCSLHLPSFAFNRVICCDSSSLLVVACRCLSLLFVAFRCFSLLCPLPLFDLFFILIALEPVEILNPSHHCYY